MPLVTLKSTVGIICDAWLICEVEPGSRDIIVARTERAMPGNRPRWGAMSATALVAEEAGDPASSTGFLEGRRRASAQFPQAVIGYLLPTLHL